MLGLRVPSPDQALLISGKKGAEGAPFKVVIGTRAFAMPLTTSCSYLTLAMQESSVGEPCVTKQGIQVNVKAVVAFKIPADERMITNAGQRFLSDQKRMPVLVGQIFAGHLRSIVGSMSIEEIVTERQKLATEVLDASKDELGKMGLIVDSFQIQSIDDAGSGYIDSMAAPQIAAVQRQAKIAQAEANQAANQAQQEAARNQAQYERDTEVAKAKFTSEAAQATAQAESESQIAQANAENATATAAAKAQSARQIAEAEANAATQTAQAERSRVAQLAQAETTKAVTSANAEAAQAGNLAAAKASQAVATEQTALAARNAELRQQQLLAEVIRPAEADAQKVKLEAIAAGEAAKARAEAAASSNRVALDQQLIEVLPEIVGRAASALSGANLTVLNGTAGVSEIMAGLVSEGMTVYETVRRQLAASSHADDQPEAPEETPNGHLEPAQR